MKCGYRPPGHFPETEEGTEEMARLDWEWIKVDVLVMEHPKIEALSDKAFRALIGLWCYCGRNRNDGLVSAKRWSEVSARVRAELLSTGLVDADGVTIHMHDFTGPEGHQRTREEAEQEAAKRSEKARNAARARWNSDGTRVLRALAEHCSRHAPSSATGMC